MWAAEFPRQNRPPGGDEFTRLMVLGERKFFRTRYDIFHVKRKCGGPQYGFEDDILVALPA